MLEPIAVLREAIKAVPAVKYALGVGGVVAAVALLFSIRIDPKVAFVGTVVTLLLMTVLVVFARLSALTSVRLALPALVLTWFALILFMVSSLALFSSVFFQKPLNLSCWLVDCPRPAPVVTPNPTPKPLPTIASVPAPTPAPSVAEPPTNPAVATTHPTATGDFSLALTSEYARLSGAIEVPILIQLQSSGGVTCYADSCRIGTESPTVPAPFPVQMGDIGKNIGEFWTKNWRFKTAMPLGTEAWKAVAERGEIGLAFLARIDPGLAQCIDRHFLRSYMYSGTPSSPGCTKNDTKRVGFLFWILKNESPRSLRDVKICYSELASNPTPSEYVKKFSTTKLTDCDKSIEMASIDANGQTIMLLSVYERDNRGFEKAFITKPLIPTAVRYSVEGKAYGYAVRPPLRERAATVPMPFGWYQQ